jgi:predicted nuclease with TOPRIM domain
MERKSVETLTDNHDKLQNAYAELQSLRDQNDELSVQLEKMKESVKALKVSQGKRGSSIKRRKGSRICSMSDGSEKMEECTDNDSPLEKIGKFHTDYEMNISMYPDGTRHIIDLYSNLASSL